MKIHSAQCVWKNEKFTLVDRIFRQINSLVNPLLSRNFCQKMARVNFRNLHTHTVTAYEKSFVESTNRNICEKVGFTEFLLNNNCEIVKIAIFDILLISRKI